MQHREKQALQTFKELQGASFSNKYLRSFFLHLLLIERKEITTSNNNNSLFEGENID
jgi:hypothetical protein